MEIGVFFQHCLETISECYMITLLYPSELQKQMLRKTEAYVVEQWHIWSSFNFSPVDRPRAIESLRGKDVVDVAAGGAHSACITSAGELFTWGKGRYGRLGHGDSEDQTRPKLVGIT